MAYTTIEQSKRLVELGLDPETADAWWCEMQPLKQEDPRALKLVPDGEPIVSLSLTKRERLAVANYNDIPAWSLDRLMELLPPSIRHYDEAERCYKNYGLNLFRSYYRCCGYAFGPSLSQENHDMLYCCSGDTWLEAVFKTMVWGLEKGYLTP